MDYHIDQENIKIKRIKDNFSFKEMRKFIYFREIENFKLKVFEIMSIWLFISIFISYIFLFSYYFDITFIILLIGILILLELINGLILMIIVPKKQKRIYENGFLISGYVIIKEGLFKIVIPIDRLIYDPDTLEEEIQDEINRVLKEVSEDKDKEDFDIEIIKK